MRAEVDQPVARRGAVHGDRLCHDALVAGVSLEGLLRAPAVTRAPRLVSHKAGLIVAGTVAALVQLAGADVGGFTGGESGFVPLLLQWVPSEDSPLRP